MTKRSNRLLGPAAFLTVLYAASASAEPPAATRAAGKSGSPAEDKAERASGKTERGDVRSDRASKGNSKGGRPEEATAPAAVGSNHPGSPGSGYHHARGRTGHFQSGFGTLSRELKEGKLKKADVQPRLAKLRETVDERRKAHRVAVYQRWGAALSSPAAVAELRHHERRMAFLNRALLLVQTDAGVKDQEKVAQRIDKLIEKENDRHERAMARFEAPQGSPGPAAAAVPGSAKNETDKGEKQ